MDEIDSIDDNTLRLELESRGKTIGPIVDSTRKLYKNLLKRLIDEEMETIENEMLNEEVDASDNDSPNWAQPVPPRQRSKSQFFLFLLSLLLAIVFAYFVKKA